MIILSILFYAMGKLSIFLRLIAYLLIIGAAIFLALQVDNLIVSIMIGLILGIFPLILLVLNIIEIIKILLKNNKNKNE